MTLSSRHIPPPSKELCSYLRREFGLDNKAMKPNQQTGGNYIIADLCHYVSAKHTLTKLNLVRDSFGRKAKKRG